MSKAPQIIVKKDTKRPRESQVRAATSSYEWIAHLHALWLIPRVDRALQRAS